MVFGLDDAALALGMTAGTAAISSAIGGGMDFEDNQQLMRESNAFNAAEAAKAREFSHDMAGTAYQRARADMEKAGLNPMLMTSQGGAATPGAASASAVTPPQTHRMENAIATALGTAKDTAMTLANIDKARAETKASDAQAAVNGVMAAKVIQDTKTSGATAKNLEVQNENLKAYTKMTQNNQWRSDQINTGLGNVLNTIKRIGSGSSFSAKDVDPTKVNPYRMERYMKSVDNSEAYSGGKSREW